MQNKVLNEVAIDQMDDLIKAVKGGSSGFDTDGTLPELGDGAVTDPLMAVGNDGKAKKIGVKTLFGKHNIRGSGNIDLYKHHITLTDDTDGIETYCDFYSSNSLNCDSLTDLKTILGDVFQLQAYGNLIASFQPIMLNNTGLQCVYVNDGFISNVTRDYSRFTISDTVTTI